MDGQVAKTRKKKPVNKFRILFFGGGWCNVLELGFSFFPISK